MDAGSRAARAWGRFVARNRWWVVAAWLVAVLAAAPLASTTARLLSPAGFSTDTEASRAADLLRAHFPEREAGVLFVVFRSDRTPLSDPGYKRQLAAWRSDLGRLVPDAATIDDPVPGRDGRTAALVVSSNQTPDHFLDMARRAVQLHEPGPASTYVGGPAAVYESFLAESELDLQQGERLSIPVALVLLLLVFGGVVAAGLPVATGLATVTTAVAVLGVVARAHVVSVFALNVSSVVGLGLGIDYSLLVVNRFREELRAGRRVEDAVSTTAGTAGVATLISGGTVMIGFGALLLSHLNVLWSMGLGGAIVVGTSLLASLTLIPALLAIAGDRVDRLALPFTGGRDTGAFWHRLAGTVMGRPFLFIAAGLAMILLIASPARALRPGVLGAESLPPGDCAAKAQELAQQDLGFPPHFPILVVVRGATDDPTISAVETRLRSLAPGRSVVGPADVPPERLPLYFRPPYAVFEVDQPAGNNDPATHQLLDRIRGTSWPPGVSVQLSGEAPAYQDFLGVLAGDFPLAFGSVLALTLLLLGIAFRSVVLPVKAVLMNLLSIGAALGVLTWVFQEGHFGTQLNFQPVGFVDATVPVVVFAGLFGLSMDYEVFLLSRIREEYRRTLDNTLAVATGLERTGQIVTSAALILVAVVSTLAFSHLTVNKSIGVTFAAAILLDATLIRLVLVPAMMRVLGGANWWPGAGRPRTQAEPAREP